jgi:CrcB protein
MIVNLLVVGAGGAVGSMLRYAVQRGFNSSLFPYGTIAVNIAGCFLAGLIAGALLKTTPQIQLFLITGFCGGFTTFSAFSLECIQLMEKGQLLSLAFYIVLSVGAALLAAFFGFKIST